MNILRKKLRGGGKKQKLKIITLVREPVARALAEFMHEFYEDMVMVQTGSDLKKSAKEYVMKQLDSNKEFMWFDEELKELTGIDIFEYPFEKDKGYTLIENQYVEILVLKMESMDKNMGIVGEFVGRPNLQYINVNVGEDKHYKYIYQKLKKQFSLRSTYLKSYYLDNDRFRHFYDDEEIVEFCSRWASDTK